MRDDKLSLSSIQYITFPVFRQPPAIQQKAQENKEKEKNQLEVDLMNEELLLSRYKILNKLGSGGFSEVYKAFDTRMERVVAIKRMAPGPKTAPRALREARTVALLNHPNIVTLYEFEETAEYYYLIMEYIEGITLQEVLAKEGNLSIDQSIAITSQICQALECAHLNSTIHRDIKPENLMILPDGRVKVMDFGIARLKNSSITREGDVVGTLPYMSPEQCKGEYVDERTDIFSLGAVLYQMLTGVAPFEAETPGAALFKILNVNPIAPNKIDPKIPRGLNNAVMKALDKEPDKRFENAAEMRSKTARYKSSSAPVKRILGPLFSTALSKSWTDQQPLSYEFEGFRARIFGFLDEYQEILKRFFSSAAVSMLSISLLQIFPFYPESLNLLLPLLLLFAVFLFPATGIGLFFLSLVLPIFNFSFFLGPLFLVLGAAYWFLFSRHRPHLSLVPFIMPFLANIQVGIVFPLAMGLFFPPAWATLLSGLGCLALETADIFGTPGQLHFLYIENNYHFLTASGAKSFQVIPLILRPFVQHPALIAQLFVWALVALVVSLATQKRSAGRDVVGLVIGTTLFTLGYTWFLQRTGAKPVPFDQLMQQLSFSLIMLLILLLFTPYQQLQAAGEEKSYAYDENEKRTNRSIEESA